MRFGSVQGSPSWPDPNACFCVCGLKALEAGVLLALREGAVQAGLPWETLAAALACEGRLHLETY